MSDLIDPNTASPTEFLRWLQLNEASHPSAFGSWSSLSASESLRDRAALEEVLKETSDFLRNSLAYVKGNERDVSLAKVIATFCHVTVTDVGIDVSWVDEDIARAVRTKKQIVGG